MPRKYDVVIDVRSYTDWLLSGDKIKGAVRENYRDFEGWSAKYSKDKTIVLYCA
jgi:rhodanese-related sulfurtransferase